MRYFKKKRIIILFSLTIVVIAIILFFVFNVRKNYINNFSEMEYRKINFLYQNPFISYFENKSECPLNIEEVIVLKPDDPEYETYLNRHFKDFLSKEKELIYYMPLYNKHNLKRDAFLIVSAGIDGKVDNLVSKEDTIFIDEFEKKLNFYNSSRYYRIGNPMQSYHDSTFSITNYFFGQKDYLIAYINCIDYYKSQIKKLYLIDSLINRIQKYNYIEHKNTTVKQIYGYHGIYSKDTIRDITKYVYFTVDNFIVKNKLYDEKDFETTTGDSVAFVGRLVKINLESKEIDFDNCIPLDSVSMALFR
ncbi:MAG: hypothetical protein KAT48_00480 [Bacteroidales bacterium]|nr:hypothetical protein [Bacteroidales bacterium]